MSKKTRKQESKRVEQQILQRISKDVWRGILVYLELKDISRLTISCQDFDFCSLAISKKQEMAFRRPYIVLKQHCENFSRFRLVRKLRIYNLSSIKNLFNFCQFNASTLEQLIFT